MFIEIFYRNQINQDHRNFVKFVKYHSFYDNIHNKLYNSERVE